MRKHSVMQFLFYRNVLICLHYWQNVLCIFANIKAHLLEAMEQYSTHFSTAEAKFVLQGRHVERQYSPLRLHFT